jgi:HlyD family secretion protein
MRGKKSRRWILVVVMVLLVVGGGIGYKSLSSDPPTVAANSLTEVKRGDIARSVVATGVVEPISNRIDIRSKASGIVKKIYVDVGDRVEPGQVLVELDRDQLVAQLREAEANLQAAQADLVSARAQLERNRILAEDYDVNLARSNHNRSIELREQNLISQADFDATKGRLEEAQNRQRAAAASIGVSKATIEQKVAGVAQFQAIVDRISDELSYTMVRSPIHGIVLSREVEVGSAVSSILTMGAGASPVLTLGDMKDVYVKGKVAETDIGKIHVGLPARITAETYKDKVFHGSVYKIAPLGKEEENVTSFEVRVSVDNPEGLLLANMSANAEIILEEHKNVLTVPEGAIVYDEKQQTFVEVPDPGSETGRKRVPVKIDIATGTKAEVVSGVKEGDKVVLQ